MMSPTKLKKDFYPNSSLWRGYHVEAGGQRVAYVYQHVSRGWIVTQPNDAQAEVIDGFKTLKRARQFVEANLGSRLFR